MSGGLVALLDDIAGLAKVAAASIDDAVGHAAKASAKSAGVLIDDAAVTPRYVVGFAAERELPIIWKIALGSLKNKMFYLLPGALLLAVFAPWAITPLLMLGGAYLSYEGAEKVYEAFWPHQAHAHEAAVKPQTTDPQVLEDAKVASAIRTDFILSAEIMAISLAAITSDEFWIRAIALALVALAITAGVYGAVALIVKADDFGLALASSKAESRTGRFRRALGRGLVAGMPGFLKALAVIGTAAMIWVGGGIVIHGLEEFGVHQPGHAIHGMGDATRDAIPGVGGFLGWVVSATGAGVFGLAFGFLLIPFVGKVLVPAWRRRPAFLRKRGSSTSPDQDGPSS